jgi:hypothetical protein
MSKIKLTHYGIMVFGDLTGVKDDIIKISDSKPKHIGDKTSIIASFKSAATTSELNEFFNIGGRSFFIFDLNKSAFYLDNFDKHEHLFGDIVSNINDVDEQEIIDIDNTFEKIQREWNNMYDMDDIDDIDDSEVIEDNVVGGMMDADRRSKKISGMTDTIITSDLTSVIAELSKMNVKDKKILIDKILDKGIDNISKRDKVYLDVLTSLDRK